MTVSQLYSVCTAVPTSARRVRGISLMHEISWKFHGKVGPFSAAKVGNVIRGIFGDPTQLLRRDITVW